MSERELLDPGKRYRSPRAGARAEVLRKLRRVSRILSFSISRWNQGAKVYDGHNYVSERGPAGWSQGWRYAGQADYPEMNPATMRDEARMYRYLAENLANLARELEDDANKVEAELAGEGS